MNDDERLKKTFDTLREDDARRAPSFEAVKRRPARRRSPWALLVPIASATAAAAVVLLWCGAERSMPGEPVAAAPVATTPAASASAIAGGERPAGPAPSRARAEDAPLDFLLDPPGVFGAPHFDTTLLRGFLR